MKAVVFNHFHYQPSVSSSRIGAEEEAEIIDGVLKYYKAYLQCDNISLVYVYVDTGVRQILDHLLHQAKNKKKLIFFDINELAFEQTLRNTLKLAVDRALRELSSDDPSFNRQNAPKFQFIGLPHLASLIASLYRIRPQLVENLSGNNKFTYDAPKFVEAVIRLARGNASSHNVSESPILRFDADVEVNQDSIAVLLSEIEDSRSQNDGYSFFSGGYGRSGINDPLNDHAVRCHWLADIKNFSNQSPYHLIPNGEHFLRDIGEFGATSIPNSKNVSPSAAMKEYITHQGGHSTNRNSEQVISGAGLYMSLSAIQLLPPFMNFENNIIWVDDHLKRRLHEVLGHLKKTDREHIGGSLFHQDRYPIPDGIREPKDIEWAKDIYFYRLVSGCIMHALISDRTGQPGKLASFVQIFLDNQRKVNLSQLEQEFMQIAQTTVNDLLRVWISAEYGNDILSNWALQNQKELQPGSGELTLKKWINSTVQDAIRYCELVENWNAYIFAIRKLVPHDAYWLFRSEI